MSTTEDTAAPSPAADQPTEPEAAAVPGVLARRLDGGLLATAGELWQRVEFWVLSRFAMIVSILMVGSLFPAKDQPWDPGAGWAAHRFVFYDSGQFLRTAEQGYFGLGRKCCSQAFFPGYMLSIRAVSHLTGGHDVWAALLITLVAGVVGAALLWRLAADQAGPVAGKIAVVALALNPLSIFMTVVYTEALFTALAVGAWLLARRGRWWWAGGVAALATGVRINGAFLVMALAVMFLIQWRKREFGVRWFDATALGLPVLVVGWYFAWLHGQTGSWTAWQDSEVLGWDRHSAAPWVGLSHGFQAAAHARGLHSMFSSYADLTAVLLGIAFSVWLLVLKRWPEATYMILNVLALVCSSTIVSSDRYTLTWFPMYVLIAERLAPPGRRWLRTLLVAIAVPLLVYTCVGWTLRVWIG